MHTPIQHMEIGIIWIISSGFLCIINICDTITISFEEVVNVDIRLLYGVNRYISEILLCGGRTQLADKRTANSSSERIRGNWIKWRKMEKVSLGEYRHSGSTRNLASSRVWQVVWFYFRLASSYRSAWDIAAIWISDVPQPKYYFCLSIWIEFIWEIVINWPLVGLHVFICICMKLSSIVQC